MPSKLVQASGLRKRFQQGREWIWPLDGASLDVEKGEVLIIRGHSGSGKTTLLCVLAGVLRPTEGTVFVCGEDLSHLDQRQLGQLRLGNVGFVFQGANMVGDLTAAENVMLVRRLLGDDRPSAARQASVLLDAVGLLERASALPRQMSAGERQRAAFARALANKPAVIFADEPTANLSSSGSACVAGLLRGMAKKDDASVVIATHDATLMLIADRIVELDGGKLYGRSVESSIDPSYCPPHPPSK